MKRLKKILALALAMAMVLGMTSMAWAANVNNEGAPYAGDTHADDTWAGTADAKISISGLEEGDTVKFYKVLAYDQNASYSVADAAAMTTGGADWGAASWKVISPFDAATGGITKAEFQAILTTGITAEVAGKIAKLVGETPDITETANASGLAEHTFTTTEAPAGLYVAIIVPQNAGVMYNPVFVASDYYTTTGGDQSSTWAPVTSPLSYSDNAMAKKADLTVTKEAAEASEATNETDGAKAVGKGDTVDFTVSTTIPEFADNYTAPVFIVKDKMTSGLEVVANSVKVYGSDGTTEITPTTVSGTDTINQFTVTYDADKLGYKVTFDPNYLLGLSAATPIVIKYSALVTEDAVENVHAEENKVTIEYSHEPSVDEEGEGKKVGDKTHHYSFTIDGNIFGDSTYKTTEVVKVGLDKDGNEITQSTTLANGKTIGALEGAEFKLFIDEACQTEYNKGAYADATATDSGNKIVSDSEGRLTLNGTTTGIPGLDAGTYYLKEMKAPDGYIKQQDPVKIEIIPTYYSDVTWTEGTGNDAVEITSNDILKSYIVKIDGAQTAEYVLHYDYKDNKTEADDDRIPVNDVTTADTNNMMTTAGDIVIGNSGPITTVEAEKQDTDDDGKIKNTQGVELPSTGGIGTTIFYVVGAILVIGAGVILITRRRMDA